MTYYTLLDPIGGVSSLHLPPHHFSRLTPLTSIDNLYSSWEFTLPHRYISCYITTYLASPNISWGAIRYTIRPCRARPSLDRAVHRAWSL